MAVEMKVALLRHSFCEGNLRHAYVGGRTDQPLCAQGIAEARARAGALEVRMESAGLSMPEVVYTSPMIRARQTAGLLFGNARLVDVEGLREMDFGDFENRSAADMERDVAYRAWVDAQCEPACPNGESKAQFSIRTCEAFEDVLRDAREAGERQVVIVAHGGTIMSLMGAFARPSRDYYSWHVAPCFGYACEARLEDGSVVLLDARAL